MISHGALREEKVAHALESPALRRIVSLCIEAPRSVKEISDAAALPLASVYRQVKQLADDGILVVERSALTADGKPYDLYRSRIRVARLEVVAGHVTITWETNAPVEDRLAALWGHLGG